MKTKFILFALMLAVGSSMVLTSCLDKNTVTPDTPEQTLAKQLAAVDVSQLQADLKIIDDSLSKWGITALQEPNGVRYTVQTEGAGAKPTLSSYVTVNYKLKLLKNRSQIEQGSNVNLALTDLIVGWKTVLPMIKQGSKITLYIPSGYAYGSFEKIDPIDHTVIMPANSNLIFEIDLLSVQ